MNLRPCNCPETHLHQGRTRRCFDCTKCLMGKVRDRNVSLSSQLNMHRKRKVPDLLVAKHKKLVVPGDG